MFSYPILDLLQDCHDPPLDEWTLEYVQQRVGCRFPCEYFDFLLQFNGGTFIRDVEFTVPHAENLGPTVLLRSFMGAPCDGWQTDSLVRQVAALRNRLPQNFLPIAHCNDNDYVLLKIVGPHCEFRGVWYWESSAQWNSAEEPSLCQLSFHFCDFLVMLTPSDCDPRLEETLPLFQAVERGELAAIERYLDQRGQVEARNERSQTLLTVAAIYRWPKIVRHLLAHAADVGARDALGRTPLHYAARRSHDSVKLLLAAGADATARDHQGKSVLGNWSLRTDQLLRAHGAER